MVESNSTSIDWREELERRVVGCRVQRCELMTTHTTFGVGGPVEGLVYVKDEAELYEVSLYLDNAGVERRILGAGSNVLVSDFGLRGATLKLFGALACIRKLDENSRVIDVEVGAGASLKRFLAWCCANQCGGMQALVGIPASIGGAIRMNAGTLDGCISHGLTQVRLLHAGCMQWVDADTIPFSYRYSGIGPDDVIIAARFRLKRQDSLTIRTAYDEVEKKRRLSQPRLRSAGCFFRNPSTGYSAGALIDKAGCKGLCVGRAQVAQKHANFLVNKGGASARDILSLSYCVINAVWQKFSVNLRPEIKLWGVFPRCA